MRNPTHFCQHVSPLETMFKGQSPGQLPGRYALHDCGEIDPFGCIFCLFFKAAHRYHRQRGVTVYSGTMQIWDLKKYELKYCRSTVSSRLFFCSVFYKEAYVS